VAKTAIFIFLKLFKKEGVNLLITFEGPDGSGKSTITRVLKKALETCGYKTILFREPGGNDFANAVRDALLNHETDVMTQIYTFAAIRSSNKANILKHIEDTVIIADRYIDSSYVYQALYHMDMDLLEKVKEINKDVTVEPDLTFVIECSKENAQKRMSARTKDVFEKTLDYNKVVKAYGVLPFLFFKREYCFVNSDGTLENAVKEVNDYLGFLDISIPDDVIEQAVTEFEQEYIHNNNTAGEQGV